jgi:transcriptional regulator with XRE-family HTH domain
MIYNQNPKKTKSGQPKIVGEFIRKRRSSLGLSQRALGQMFEPAVTTQFISNVERGVTPLPPAHVPTLAKSLLVPEDELMGLLEKEYAAKLSGRLGKEGLEGVLPPNSEAKNQIHVEPKHFELMRSIYDAFHRADTQTQGAFLTVCESILKIRTKQPEAVGATSSHLRYDGDES